MLTKVNFILIASSDIAKLQGVLSQNVDFRPMEFNYLAHVSPAWIFSATSKYFIVHHRLSLTTTKHPKLTRLAMQCLSHKILVYIVHKPGCGLKVEFYLSICYSLCRFLNAPSYCRREGMWDTMLDVYMYHGL